MEKIKSTSSKIQLSEIILRLAENLKILVIVPSILLFLVICYLIFFAKPQYVSNAKIMSSSNEKEISQVAGLAYQFGIDIPLGNSEPNWVYEEIIKSRTLAKKVLNRRFDTVNYGKNKALVEILTYFYELPDYGIDTLLIITADEFIKNIVSVYEDPKTRVYSLSINSFEPNLSKEIAEVVIEELELHQNQYNKKITSKTRKFIEERINETKSSLEASEEKFKKFRERNRRIENSFLLQMELERLQREVNVLTEVFTTLKTQLETTKIEEVRDSDYVIIIDAPELPLEKSSPKILLSILITFLSSLSIAIIIIIFKSFSFISSTTDDENIKKASLIAKNKFKYLTRGHSER